MYGSLKDYLKKLKANRLHSLHRSHPQHEGANPSSRAEEGCICSCQCHYQIKNNASSLSEVSEQGSAHVHQQVASSSPFHHARPLDSSGYHDPIGSAHAARLLRLLESDYHFQSNSSITEMGHENGQNGALGSHSNTENSVLPRSGGVESMCAYHPCILENYPYQYDWVPAQQVVSSYYNSYYNHRNDITKRETNIPVEITGSDAPCFTELPLYVNTPAKGGSMPTDILCSNSSLLTIKSNDTLPSYANITKEETASINCTCCCPDYPYAHNENSSHNGLSLTCVYCSTQEESGNPQREVKCCPSDFHSMEGKLSYFEVLDFSNQIAKGMEHLEKMKVSVIALHCFVMCIVCSV